VLWTNTRSILTTVIDSSVKTSSSCARPSSGWAVLTETQRRKQRRVGILRERSRHELAEPELADEVRPGSE
jgi:hypothetical protein